MAGVAGRSGRKPKDAEQRLIEQLKPYEEEWVKILGKAIQEGKPWALKLFAEYRWTKPKPSIETTVNLLNLPEWISEL